MVLPCLVLFEFIVFAEFNHRFIRGNWYKSNVNMALAKHYNITPTFFCKNYDCIICLEISCEFQNFFTNCR